MKKSLDKDSKRLRKISKLSYVSLALVLLSLMIILAVSITAKYIDIIPVKIGLTTLCVGSDLACVVLAIIDLSKKDRKKILSIITLIVSVSLVVFFVYISLVIYTLSKFM